MRLKIYDAMWLIHYGTRAEKYKEYSYASYPLGGVKFLVKNIMDDIWRGNQVLVCFDSRTNKNSIFAGYKSNRPYLAEIVSQSHFAYNVLMKCGITCLKRDGLEADDLVASSVTKFRNNFDEIIIVSNDKDLAHNVFNKVRVEACSIDGIDIRPENFIIAAARIPIVYNTISTYKVLTGDFSDTIPNFHADNGKRGADIYREFIAFTEEKIPESATRPYLLSKKELFEFFLKSITYLTDRDREELKARISVIFPTVVEIAEMPCCDDNNLDRQEIAKLLSVLGEDLLLNQFKMKKMRLSPEEFNEFKASAQMLKDDTFAIDNNCPIHESFVLEEYDFNLRLFE